MSLPDSLPLLRGTEPGGFLPTQNFAWLGLGVLVALFALVAYLKHQRNGPTITQPDAPKRRWPVLLTKRATPDFAVLSSKRLTPHHSLHDVHWQGRRLLVGCAGRSIRLLSDTGDDSAPQPLPQPAGGGHVVRPAEDQV